MANQLAESVAAAENAQGSIDVAILNAGIYQPQDGSAIDPAIYANHMDVNGMGVVNALAAIVPRMITRGGGHIVIISSVAGWRACQNRLPMALPRQRWISLAESLHFDLQPKGVRLQVICPGFVESEATAVNDFEMPGLMTADAAAQAIIDAMTKNDFLVHFPKSFTRSMAWLRFRLINGFSGLSADEQDMSNGKIESKLINSYVTAFTSLRPETLMRCWRLLKLMWFSSTLLTICRVRRLLALFSNICSRPRSNRNSPFPTSSIPHRQIGMLPICGGG